MKQFTLFLAVFVALIVSPFARAETAQPLNEQYIAAIKAGCGDALQGIQRVNRSEALARVNRGQEYESLLKLIAAFNSRVVLNKLDAPVLTGTTAKLQTKFTAFHDDYLTYANKIDNTLKINCRVAPVTFYDNLSAARDARAKVAQDVQEINTLLDEYQKGLDTLKVQLNTLEQVSP